MRARSVAHSTRGQLAHGLAPRQHQVPRSSRGPACHSHDSWRPTGCRRYLDSGTASWGIEWLNRAFPFESRTPGSKRSCPRSHGADTPSRHCLPKSRRRFRELWLQETPGVRARGFEPRRGNDRGKSAGREHDLRKALPHRRSFSPVGLRQRDGAQARQRRSWCN